MSNAARAPIPRRDFTEHFVRFYDDELPVIDEVVQFALRALRDKGVAIVIATDAHLSAIVPRLERAARGPRSGKLICAEAQAALAGFMVDGWPDDERFFATIGALVADAAARADAAPIHAFGEMVAILGAAGQYDAALRLEMLWNQLARRHAFKLFCAYPQALFSHPSQLGVFSEICRAHGRVLPAEILTDVGAATANRLIAPWQRKAAELESEVQRRCEAEAALRRRERELVDFVMNVPVAAAFLAGPDHVFRLANHGYRELVGCPEPIGRTYADVCPDEKLGGDVAQLLSRCYTSGRSIHRDEYRIEMTRTDGAFEPRYFSFNFKPSRSDGGEVEGVIAVAVEVTEQVRNRERLEKSHAERERLLVELERASRAKDEFLAMLGHELRNPLSPIVTALQLMRMRSDGETSHEQSIIARQVEHLVRLVDDLLDVARLTRGKIELRRRTVNVSDVLNHAIEMASLLLEQRNHRLTVEAEQDLVWQVDAARMAQVVSNLLTNAARYSAVGEEVRLAASRGPGETIEISVRDNGIGISEKMLPRVFDLFFQGKRNLDRAEGGLGIGLALVKNLVELHGGNVSAASAGPGRGSEFTIRVPARAAGHSHRSPGARGPSVLSERTAQAAPPPKNGCRILLVDDNVDAVEALALLLTECGHRVEAVHDPAAALQIVGRFKPEIAVVDIGLPVMDGYELIGSLRAMPATRECMYIALTGYGQQADRLRSEAAGFDHHLVKPVDLAHLTRLIDAFQAEKAAHSAESRGS